METGKKISKNSVLARHRDIAPFSESYSEEDFVNDCRMFEAMILDLCPENQDLFACYYLSHLKKGRVDTVKLIKFKASLLINSDNKDWLQSQPKSFLVKLKRKLKKMKKKVEK